MITDVVTEKVIPGSTKLITAEAEVMFITGDPNLVLELSHGAVVLQNLPLTVWVDHTGLHCLLDDLSIYTYTNKRGIQIMTLQFSQTNPRVQYSLFTITYTGRKTL